MMDTIPGPWRAQGYDVVTAEDSRLVCVVDFLGRNADTAISTARLIAATPDLLVACRRLIGYCSKRDGTLAPFDDWITCFLEDGSALTECVESAQSAIAKAEGRAESRA